MVITEINVKLPSCGESPRLLAYCGLVLDGDFAVHDLKLIQGEMGVFLAMPSRWKKDRCPNCQGRNELKAVYCCMCGEALPLHGRCALDEGRPGQDHVDLFHPLNNAARTWIQDAVLDAYDRRITR